jgi:predicted enzyme related to lactoylglutathione lyase
MGKELPEVGGDYRHVTSVHIDDGHFADYADFLARDSSIQNWMHRSRLNGILIDCNTKDIDAAARFWAEALGRPVDPGHPGTRGNYRMLETPENEISVQVQRVDHQSRVHIDIETDDIPAEVQRLERLGATVVKRMERWVIMEAPSGQRFCVVRVQRDGFEEDSNAWD